MKKRHSSSHKSSRKKSSNKKPTEKEKLPVVPPIYHRLYGILANPVSGEKELHPITVIQSKEDEDELTHMKMTKYYIHFNHLDKRMDKWVSANEVFTKDQLISLKNKYKIFDDHLKSQLRLSIDSSRRSSIDVRRASIDRSLDISQSSIDFKGERRTPLTSPTPKRSTSHAAKSPMHEERMLASSPVSVLDRIPSSSPPLDRQMSVLSLPCESPRIDSRSPSDNKAKTGRGPMIRLSSPSVETPEGEDEDEGTMFELPEEDLERLNAIAASNIDEILEEEIDGEDESMNHSGEVIRMKNVNKIVINKFEISCWYFSPYPIFHNINPTLFTNNQAPGLISNNKAAPSVLTSHSNKPTFSLSSSSSSSVSASTTTTIPTTTASPTTTTATPHPHPSISSEESKIVDTLYICDFCLDFYLSKNDYLKHCYLTHPPGNEIYRNKNNSLFEIDGGKEVAYTQNLCLLSKLFLEHKSCYWDTVFFLFYVLTEVDSTGAHIVGYFSKAKQSAQACILIIPCYQRKGYGTFLIDISYSLSLIEHKTGTPERPLSDLGKISYSAYWIEKLVYVLKKGNAETLSITDICHMTGMASDDVIDTLIEHKILKYHNYEYYIDLSPSVLDKLTTSTKNINKVKTESLHFVPYIPLKRRKVNG